MLNIPVGTIHEKKNMSIDPPSEKEEKSSSPHLLKSKIEQYKDEVIKEQDELHHIQDIPSDEEDIQIGNFYKQADKSEFSSQEGGDSQMNLSSQEYIRNFMK